MVFTELKQFIPLLKTESKKEVIKKQNTKSGDMIIDRAKNMVNSMDLPKWFSPAEFMKYYPKSTVNNRLRALHKVGFLEKRIYPNYVLYRKVVK